MRGRYLIRNPLKARLLGLLDDALALARSPVIPPIPENPERILVSNWAHLGDVLLTLPAIRWLRLRYPKARIDMVLATRSAVVIEGQGLVDEMFLIDHWRINREPIRLGEKLRRYAIASAEAVTRLRAHRYDMAIDFYEYYPTAHVELARARIPVRIGYQSGGLGPLLTHPIPWTDDHRHVIAHHADLLAPLVKPGEPRPTLAPFYALPPAREEPPLPQGYVLVHTGAGASYKEWPEEKWRDVVEKLHARGHPIVLAGLGAREEARAARLAGATPGAVDLSGRLDWNGLVRVIAGARLMLCLDSVSAHLGAAFAVPTVALWTGTTDPAQWGPMNEKAILLSGKVPCAPCHRTGCDTMDCVNRVTPGEVEGAIGRLIG
jgi:heptosyltransferase-2